MNKLIMIGLVLSSSIFAQTRSLKWGEIRNQWNSSFERQYEQFVARLGEARARRQCFTTEGCILSPKANPMYYYKNPVGLKIRSDCADLPFVLRAYFAWMNHLPFSFPSWPRAILPQELENMQKRIEQYDSYIATYQQELREAKVKVVTQKQKVEILYSQYKSAERKNRKEYKRNYRNAKKELSKAKKVVETINDNIEHLLKEQKDLKRDLVKKSKKYAKRDIRYTPYGNIITKRINVSEKMSINHVIDEVNNKVSTASYRTRANKYDQGENYRDFYPIKINRQAIHPGTVLYDPSGHIAVVYKVTKDGRILLIDAHPDQSLTHITYGKKFSRSSINISGGFMNWRPFKVYDGKFIPTANRELSDYSLEQYTGVPERDPQEVTYRNAEYFLNGEKVNFYDYVRGKLFVGRVRYNPINELRERIGELCEDLQARAASVNQAIAKGIDKKKHPKKLPKNIYGTDGEWEAFSTPSRDARFKALFLETQSMVKRYLKMEENDDRKIEYDGDNLALDMQIIYKREANRCKVGVTLSDGERIGISLAEVERKLFDLSFDPYHCIELRWGLTEHAENSAACKDRTKMKWYKAEAPLRNQIKRDYKEEMDYSLMGLRFHHLGVKEKPYLNIRSIIEDYL